MENFEFNFTVVVVIVVFFGPTYLVLRLIIGLKVIRFLAALPMEKIEKLANIYDKVFNPKWDVKFSFKSFISFIKKWISNLPDDDSG